MKFNSLNAFQAAALLLLFLPHLISIARKDQPRVMPVSRAAGRLRTASFWLCVLFMIIPVSYRHERIMFEFGFTSGAWFGVYLAGTLILILVNTIFWILYTGLREKAFIRLMLYLIPAITFSFIGFLMKAPLLFLFGLLYTGCILFLRRKSS